MIDRLRSPKRCRRPASGIGAGVLALGLLAACAAGAAGEVHRIHLEGYFSDWAELAPVWVDPTGDGGTSGIDIGSIWAADDETHLWMSFEVGNERLAQSGNQLAIFIDGDDNPATGFPISGIGAELRWSLGDRQGYFFVGSGWTVIPWGPVGFSCLPSHSSTRFEVAFDRDAVPDGTHPLFSSPTIRLLLHDLVGNGDWAPNAGTTIPYAFDQGTLPELPTIGLEPSGDGALRLLDWNILNDGIFDTGKQPAFRRILQACNPDVIAFEEIYNHDATQTRTLIQQWLGGTWAAQKVSDKVVLTRGTITNYWSIAGGRAGAFLLSPQGIFPADVLVIACHLSCCDADAARQSQVDQIMAFVRDAKTPGGLLDLTSENTIVITGDMNFVGSSRQLLTLLTGDIYDDANYGPDFHPDWDETDLYDQTLRQPMNTLGYTWYESGNAYWPGRLDFTIYTDSQTHCEKDFVLQTEFLPPEFLTQYGLQAGDSGGASDHLPCVEDLAPGSQGIADGLPGAPSRVRLALAGPNPSAGRVALRLSVGEAAGAIGDSRLGLAVVDAMGRRVTTLARGPFTPGDHAISWDGTDGRGRPVPSGAYWVRVGGTAPATTGVRVVLLR
jgi:hypothetical protein